MLRVYRSFLILLMFVATTQAQTAPVFTISSNYTFACTGQSILFKALADSGLTYNYKWSVSPARNAVLSTTEGSSALVTFEKDLTYSITVSASDGSNTTVITKKIPAYKSARASFNATLDNTGFPANLVLTNYAGSSVYTTWSFSDQTALDSSYSTVKPYTTSGSYSVTLFAYGQKGCNDTSSYAFRISDSSSVVLPNVFTPNRDEINDVFKPVTTGITEMHVYICNREGINISSWHKPNGTWDGRTSAGEVCQEGVYFVVLEAKGFDGKIYKMKSTLTLLR